MGFILLLAGSHYFNKKIEIWWKHNRVSFLFFIFWEEEERGERKKRGKEERGKRRKRRKEERGKRKRGRERKNNKK